MPLKHKKVSGLQNVDANHIGGADWDDNHLYTAGTPFIAGRISMFYDGISLTQNHSPTFASFTKIQAGGYQYLLDPAQLPVADNADLVSSGMISVWPNPLPANWQLQYYSEAGEWMFQFLYNNSAADPAFIWRVDGMMLAEVV